MSRWSLPPTSPLRRLLAARDPRTRILIWATVAGLIFGAIEFGKPLEDVLRIGRNALRQHPASGDIVVVAIDDRSIQALRKHPWPRSQHAQLLDGLQRLGARQILVDLKFLSPSEPSQDAALAEVLAKSKPKIILAAQTAIDPVTGQRIVALPIMSLRKHADVADINVRFNFHGWVWKLPYASNSTSGVFPSFAAKMAGVKAVPEKLFMIDYGIDPRSIQTISALDVINNKLPSGSLAGKYVIVGTTAPVLGDFFFMPGHGQMPGAYLHALGSETLKSGTPRTLHWMLPLSFGLAAAAFVLRRPTLGASFLTSLLGTITLLTFPIGFEALQIHVEIVPALFVLLVVTVAWSWASLRRSYEVRGTVNPVSGLLNLDMLRRQSSNHERILIATRILNYPQIASALPPHAERGLIEQIAYRLTLGMAGQELYQGDEGIFAWFSDLPTVAAAGEHLEALHGFFRNAVTVKDKQIDLTLSFGIDADFGRSPANRLGSALVACDEASVEGRRWKAYDPAALKDVEWKLSLLGQLDRAIDSGDFWVAYQAKLDLATGSICGAEALARWTHPDKGAIAPFGFIIAAEQNDRIEKLTRFVLEEAIKAAASINAVGTPFNVAVNLSTRLIGDRAFTDVVEALLKKHRLAPQYLTLEVTETAALDSGNGDMETLTRLRSLGVNIAIDDYGTGLSTLEYLKKIPATEIKIDQSFIAAVTKSHSDRLMVHSTIQLAHSLGRIVVAEGVEDKATLDALIALGCDHAQGFHIGRPMSLYAFTDALLRERREKVPRHG